MVCTGSVLQFAWQLSVLKTTADALPCNEKIVSGNTIYHIYSENNFFNSALVNANMNLPAIWHGNKICGGKQAVKEIKASRLLPSN